MPGPAESDRSFWRDRSVLVTGASGLVGSWVVKALLERGAAPVCLVRDWVPRSELVRSGTLEKATVVRGDVTDSSLLERMLGEHEVESVVHLAAQTIVGIANRNPLSTFESNVRGTWCVLEACRRSPLVREIVVASSDKAYGEQEKLPYEETAPLAGRHPYDASKSCADLLALSYAKTFSLPVVVTRCGNFYGGGDLNWNRIVPGTIRSLLRGERPIVRSDGKFVRDYFYVEDGAEAYLALVSALARDRSLAGEAWNFSNEQPVSVLEMVEKIRRLAGRLDLEPVVKNEATNEIRRQFLSARKARERLGWQPRFDLDEGLGRTIEWYRKLLASEGS